MQTDSTRRLAIDGGPPTIPEGPPAWPPDDPAVAAALAASVADGSWGRYVAGHCERLAAELARCQAVPHVQLCCSGTFAVELALRGLGVGADDEVLLAGYDFPGNFRAIEAVGARPVLVDIDPATWCLDARLLEAAGGPRTRAVVVSHLHGGLAATSAIRGLADRHGWAVVEDASQATGAIVEGRPAGSWGDAGVLSFGGSKLLTAGRGGALLTPHADVHQRAKIYCERGNDAFALSELQAIVLGPQLQTLGERNRRRRASAVRLVEQLRAVAALRPVRLDFAASLPSYYKLAWLLDDARIDRPRLVAALAAEGVAIDAGFRGFVRRGPRRCRRVGPLPHSERAAEATLILHHPVLLSDAAVVDRVAEAVRKVFRRLNGVRVQQPGPPASG